MSSNDSSFLAPVGEVADWRMVLLVDAADEAGLLAAVPATPEDMSGRLGLDAHAVTVVLEALACSGVVRKAADGRFEPGPAWPGAEASAVLTHHASCLKLWAGALAGRLRGESAPPAQLAANPARWLEAVAAHARAVAPSSVDAVLQHIPGAANLLDLGGGHGVYAAEFARRGLAVTMQDREAVIDIAHSQGDLEAAGIELYAADLFESIAPGPFDVIFCAGVTHALSPELNLALFERVRSHLAPGGTLVVQAFARNGGAVSALFAVQMLAVARGGDAHPEASTRRWLADSGYEVTATCSAGEGVTMVFARIHGDVAATAD